MLKVNFDESKVNSILNNGGVVAFVTDTVWGIGCNPNNETAINKIYEIKGRDRTKPLILMSNKTEYLMPYVKNLSNSAKSLIETYFPGALTVIAEKSALTSDSVSAQKNTIGIRVPNNEFFQYLCSVIDTHVLATTSANISNQKTSVCKKDVELSIGKDLYKIYGEDTYCEGIASTVVMVDKNNNVKILRRGSVNLEDCI